MPSNVYPLANPTRRELRKFTGRGPLQRWLSQLGREAALVDTDFFGATLPTYMTTGGAGTAAAFPATGRGGVVNLVTGGVDNQCSIVYVAGRQFAGNNNAWVSARFFLSSVTTGNVQVGFVDSVAAGVLGATGVGAIVSPLADPPTLVAGVADCVVATYDLSSALANPVNWRFAGSRTSSPWLVTPTTTVSGLAAPAASTYVWVTVSLRRTNLTTDDVAAIMFINGTETARKAAGAVSNTADLCPFISIGATDTTSRTMTLDRFMAGLDREVED